MPTRDPHQLNRIVNRIRSTRPQSVPDMGVGFGENGMRARESLELNSRKPEYGNQYDTHRSPWQRRGFPPFVHAPERKLRRRRS